MPTVPTNTKCSTLGCKNTKAKFSGSCVEHGGRDIYEYKRNEVKRKESAYKYNSKQWRVFRQIQLSRYPICAGCKADGIITSAIHVDHVFPWIQIGEHAFIHNLYQSLCQPCHSSKTQLEQQGVFRMYGNPHMDYKHSDYRIAVANPK